MGAVFRTVGEVGQQLLDEVVILVVDFEAGVEGALATGFQELEGFVEVHSSEMKNERMKDEKLGKREW